MTVDYQESREPTIFNSLLMLFFVGIFLFVALLYRQMDLALLGILILVVVVGAKVWCSMSPAHIQCDSLVDTRRVFPEESVTLVTTVENGKWLPVCLRIMWSFGSALKPEGDNGSTIWQTAFVLWHQTVKFHQKFIALRRGVYPVGPPRIRTSDLLGFFEKEKSVPDATHIVVYPRRVSLRPVAIRKRDLFGAPGAKSPVQDPIYILGTRDYQLSRKIFEPSEQEKVLLTLDVGSFEKSNQKECFERTLEVVASLAVKLDGMGYAVGFAANGTLTSCNSSVTPIIRGSRKIPAILETLARMQTMPSGSITQVIKQSLGSQRGVSCVHLCYEDDPSVADMEKFFQKRQIPVTFLVGRRDRKSQPARGKKGIYLYSIDEIRIDRSRQT
jgi:uncharacterized protein (DUF58 family)